MSLYEQCRVLFVTCGICKLCDEQCDVSQCALCGLGAIPLSKHLCGTANDTLNQFTATVLDVTATVLDGTVYLIGGLATDTSHR